MLSYRCGWLVTLGTLTILASSASLPSNMVVTSPMTSTNNDLTNIATTPSTISNSVTRNFFPKIKEIKGKDLTLTTRTSSEREDDDVVLGSYIGSDDKRYVATSINGGDIIREDDHFYRNMEDNIIHGDDNEGDHNSYESGQRNKNEDGDDNVNEDGMNGNDDENEDEEHDDSDDKYGNIESENENTEEEKEDEEENNEDEEKEDDDEEVEDDDNDDDSSEEEEDDEEGEDDDYDDDSSEEDDDEEGEDDDYDDDSSEKEDDDDEEGEDDDDSSEDDDENETETNSGNGDDDDDSTNVNGGTYENKDEIYNENEDDENSENRVERDTDNDDENYSVGESDTDDVHNEGKDTGDSENVNKHDSHEVDKWNRQDTHLTNNRDMDKTDDNYEVHYINPFYHKEGVDYDEKNYSGMYKYWVNNNNDAEDAPNDKVEHPEFKKVYTNPQEKQSTNILPTFPDGENGLGNVLPDEESLDGHATPVKERLNFADISVSESIQEEVLDDTSILKSKRRQYFTDDGFLTTDEGFPLINEEMFIPNEGIVHKGDTLIVLSDEQLRNIDQVIVTGTPAVSLNEEALTENTIQYKIVPNEEYTITPSVSSTPNTIGLVTPQFLDQEMMASLQYQEQDTHEEDYIFFVSDVSSDEPQTPSVSSSYILSHTSTTSNTTTTPTKFLTTNDPHTTTGEDITQEELEEILRKYKDYIVTDGQYEVWEADEDISEENVDIADISPAESTGILNGLEVTPTTYLDESNNPSDLEPFSVTPDTNKSFTNTVTPNYSHLYEELTKSQHLTSEDKLHLRALERLRRTVASLGGEDTIHKDPHLHHIVRRQLRGDEACGAISRRRREIKNFSFISHNTVKSLLPRTRRGVNNIGMRLEQGNASYKALYNQYKKMCNFIAMAVFEK